MNNAILDIGANNGVDGLGYALFNKNFNVYAFEANPELVRKINFNKELIEKFLNIKIINYQIIEKAVSNYNGTDDFFISDYDLCSSLLKYKFVKTKKKILCEVITLKKFCEDNEIDNIAYLHSDTQGSDLNVLKGLNEHINKVHSGVIETMIEKEDIKYEGASSFEDFEKFFLENHFQILKKTFNDPAHKEINVFFKNLNISKKNLLNVKEFNRRFIQRIVENRTTLKDRIFKFFFNKFLN